MKIFIGTHNVCDAPNLLKQGFNKLGIDADIACMNEHAFYENATSCYDIKSLWESTACSVQNNNIKVTDVPQEFYDIANKYDVFIFVAGHSLLPRMLDLPILKSMNKTIIAYHTGSEIRHEITAVEFWNAYGHAFPLSTYPRILTNEWWTLTAYSHNLFNKTYNMRMSEMYATSVLTSPAAANLSVRPYMQMILPLDASQCKLSIPKNDVPIVVHAPSSRTFKRTDIVLQTLQELADEGVDFKVSFLENAKNAQVLKTLTCADVLIDQISCGSVARLALEGMASGCAVLTGNTAAIAWPPDRPAVSVTPTSFKERLRKVLTDKKLRLELAAKGYEYMQKDYHSPMGAAQSILDSIENEKNNKFDYYPTAFTEIATKIPDEPLPHFLQKMTLDILKQHGTSPKTELARLEHEGFIPEGGEGANVPLWDMSKLHKIGPWNWCGKHIPVPSFDTEHSLA